MNTEGYRFGFNGQEKSPEIAEGHYTAEFWEYDSRIGRRWNRDPVVFAWQSPYSTFDNNPIAFSDPYGATAVDPNGGGCPECEGTKVLDEVEVKASPQTLLGKAKLAANRLKEHLKKVGETVTEVLPRLQVLVGSAADAYVSDMLMKPEPFLTPKDWGGGEFADIARRGYMAGHTAAAVQGVGEMATGDGMMVGGGTVSLTGGGAVVGVPAMAVGAGVTAHGAVVTSVATANLIKMNMDEKDNEVHDNIETNGSEKSVSKSINSNIGKNANKMSLDEIQKFLGGGKNWHQTSLKSKFLAKFKKLLKGDTNADFFYDKVTREVYLKSNKSGNWIPTGEKF